MTTPACDEKLSRFARQPFLFKLSSRRVWREGTQEKKALVAPQHAVGLLEPSRWSPCNLLESR